MTTLAGKTVFLTGALRGLGVYIARVLAKAQTALVCVSRLPSGLVHTCDAILATGGKAIAIPVDLRKTTKFSAPNQQTQDIVVPIDVLMNHAGIKFNGAIGNYSLAEIQSLLNSNLLAAMKLTDFSLPNMMERGSGRIANITSLAVTKLTVAFNRVYTATKTGLIMETDAIFNHRSAGLNHSYVAVGSHHS